MKTIYLAEDDENIRELVIYAMKTAGFETIGFETGRLLFEKLKSQTPDLVILDIMLPEEDGLSILRRIKQSLVYRDIPVIMLTAKGGEVDRVKGLDLGADDYIVKPFSVLELIARVKAVLRRINKEENSGVIGDSDIEINNMKRQVLAKGKEVELTLKEFELLHYLVINKEVVLSREKLLNHVWGYDYDSTRTVDMHIKTLRQKLGEAGEGIKTVRGVGYKYETKNID